MLRDARMMVRRDLADAIAWLDGFVELASSSGRGGRHDRAAMMRRMMGVVGMVAMMRATCDGGASLRLVQANLADGVVGRDVRVDVDLVEEDRAGRCALRQGNVAGAVDAAAALGGGG